MKIALVVLVAVAAAGCGSEAEPKDPQAALKQMFEQYNSALADGDYAKACERMAPEFVYLTRQQLQAKGVANPPKECAELWATSVERKLTDPDLLKDASEDARFDGADVTGATARVDWSEFLADDDRIAMTTYARRDDDGRWKITSISD